MRRIVYLIVLALFASSAGVLKADCEQCATENLVSCQSSGTDVICVYSDGSYTHQVRHRTP